MDIYTLFDEDEEITIETYLNKYGIEDAEKYLFPNKNNIESPFLYNNMKDAVDTIKYHILMNSSIYMIVDPDTDGVMSSVEMYQYLKLVNPNLKIKLLLHDGKERGLNDEKLLKEILEDHRDLLIITDAGSNEVDATRMVYESGTDVVVLDHHDLKTPIDCGVIVNNQFKNQECNKCGSGALVTHKLLQALDNELDVKYSNMFVDLVALSLISDSMDVRDYENRAYLNFTILNDKIQNKFLKQLVSDYIFKDTDNITMRDFSWSIVPKINSVIRSDNAEMKQQVIKAFLGFGDFETISSECGEYHKQQIERVDDLIQKLSSNINDNNKVIIISSEQMPKAYSGLVAGKLSELFQKPCILGKIKNGELLGSLRSPIPLRKILDEREEVIFAQGHECACGIGIKADKIDSLLEFLNTLDLSYSPKTEVVQSYAMNNIPNRIWGVFEPYTKLWGKDLPKPQFHVSKIRFNSKDIKLIGAKKNTIKIDVNGVSILYFNSNEQVRKDFCVGENQILEMECLCSLNLNIWNSRKNNQIIIYDYNIHKQTIEDLFS